MLDYKVRTERPGDEEAIAAVIRAAFAGHPFSDQSEAQIVVNLRAAGAMTLSLVAEQDGEVVGHIAFSPVTIDGAECGWFGLGPVSVAPAFQAAGIGSALIREGLARIAGEGANGCVLLGYPSYYVRFGFQSDPALTWSGAANPHFQRLILRGEPPKGDVAYHSAFAA